MGPLCSGKSEVINSLDEIVLNFSVSTVYQLFEKVPAHIASNLWSQGHGILTYNPLSYGISLKDRVIGLTDSEQMLITMLFMNKLSKYEFSDKLQSLVIASNNDHISELFSVICDVTMSIYDSRHEYGENVRKFYSINRNMFFILISCILFSFLP